jgi:hypothetical protein
MASQFADATARLAYAVDPIYDAGAGRRFLQLDTNAVYTAVRGGTGADCWSLEYYLDDLTSSLGLPLNDFREVDGSGDVSNIAGNGGLLASDTTPILRGDAAESLEISWATGNTDIIATQLALPINFSGASDVLIELLVSSGATDAATCTVETGWDGGTLVSDSASDAATKSATKHWITATVAAADVPNSARTLTVILTFAAHATDTIQLHAARVVYERLRAA